MEREGEVSQQGRSTPVHVPSAVLLGCSISFFCFVLQTFSTSNYNVFVPQKRACRSSGGADCC